MSAQVILSDLSFSYGGAADVLRKVSLTLSDGWTGMVGENGTGKTTLLRILAGELVADPSTLQRIPGDMVIRYCPQRVGELSDSVKALAHRWDGQVQRIMGRLRLRPADLSRWPSLSPGERKRWQLAAALADAPDLLLLDEPTNHLDTEARDLLLDQLLRFRGIGVVVSHDRALLDRLAGGVLRLSAGGEVRSYAGNYSGARDTWRTEERHLRERLGQLQSTRKKLKKRLDATRESHRAAQRATSTGRRMKNLRDSDARSMAAKGRAESGERSVGRKVTVLRREMERAQEAVRGAGVPEEVGGSVFFLAEPAPKPTLVHLKRTSILRGGRKVLRQLDLVVGRGSRVHLQGPNGSGKTTLLGALLKASTLPGERILYLPQELTPEEVGTNLKEMRGLPDERKGKLLQIVAALGVPPERLLGSTAPSPGEARKLALALGLTRQAWLLILDEPTNHLDLPSIERLETALAEYASALILVTHDRRFAAGVTQDVWRIEGGRVRTGGDREVG